jgi:hypothetical protein
VADVKIHILTTLILPAITWLSTKYDMDLGTNPRMLECMNYPSLLGGIFSFSDTFHHMTSEGM